MARPRSNLLCNATKLASCNNNEAELFVCLKRASNIKVAPRTPEPEDRCYAVAAEMLAICR